MVELVVGASLVAVLDVVMVLSASDEVVVLSLWRFRR